MSVELEKKLLVYKCVKTKVGCLWKQLWFFWGCCTWKNVQPYTCSNCNQ